MLDMENNNSRTFLSASVWISSSTLLFRLAPGLPPCSRQIPASPSLSQFIKSWLRTNEQVMQSLELKVGFCGGWSIRERPRCGMKPLSSLEAEQSQSAANIISEDFLWIRMTGNVGAFPPFCKISVSLMCKRCSTGWRFGENLSLVWEKVYDTAGFGWWQMEGCGHKEMSNHHQARWAVLNEKTLSFREAKKALPWTEAPAAAWNRSGKLFHPLLPSSAPPVVWLNWIWSDTQVSSTKSFQLFSFSLRWICQVNRWSFRTSRFVQNIYERNNPWVKTSSQILTDGLSSP